VKVLAISPSKQEVIVGGMNMLRLLKIEPDLSIKTIVRNISNNKQAGQRGATEIKWNQRQPNMVITSRIQQISVWDLSGGNVNLVKRYEQKNKVVSLSWDPFNEGRFISASGGSITLWDNSIDKQVMCLENINNV
jgi:WD40 repeat protein